MPPPGHYFVNTSLVYHQALQRNEPELHGADTSVFISHVSLKKCTVAKEADRFYRNRYSNGLASLEEASDILQRVGRLVTCELVRHGIVGRLRVDHGLEFVTSCGRLSLGLGSEQTTKILQQR